MPVLPPRVSDVLVSLRGAIEEKGWHGPTVLEAISGLTDEQGARRVPGASHTIAELVDHVRFWEAMGLHHATDGDEPRPHEDWSSSGALSEAARRLRQTHARLMEAVGRLSEGDLDREVRTADGPMMPLGHVLHGLAAHGTYHAGQIRQLRVMLGE